MSDYKTAFRSILETVQMGVARHGVAITDDHIQYSSGDCTVVLGFSTLRILVVDAKKNATISVVPTSIEVGDYKLQKQLSIGLYDSDLRHEQNDSLYIEGGKLFQFNTMYDFDFSILSEIMPKYLEIVKSILDSKYSSRVYQSIISDAINSLERTCEQYAAE